MHKAYLDLICSMRKAYSGANIQRLYQTTKKSSKNISPKILRLVFRYFTKKDHLFWIIVCRIQQKKVTLQRKRNRYII